MAKLIASSSYAITDVAEKAIDRTEISFWHGLSATKRPLGVYDCAGRDHYFANEFNVTSGKTYTVRMIAKQTNGSIRLAGGIWYTAMTSGNAWDLYGALTLVGEASEDGIGVYERKFAVPSGKTKAKIYVQIEQASTNGPTAWRIYDGQVFDENGQKLVTYQNNYVALTSPMATPNGTYIWKRTITYYTDGSNSTIWDYSGVGEKGVKGDPGNDGLPGVPGVGIQSTTSTYGISATESAQPATWSSSVPSLVKGQYLWTKNVWTYTDGRSETGYNKTYIAKDGNNGTNGIAGKDGVGITSTVITYATSSSGTTVPTSGWTSAVPSVSPGQYLWTKTFWTYTDSTSETGYSVARMGTNGQTPYVHWAYSDNADGAGMSTTDTGQRYIGHYSDYTQADSTDKTKYKWADRWAKIEVGGRNIIRNSAFGNAIDSSERFTVGGVTYVNKTIPNWNNLYNIGIPNPTTSYHAIYKEAFNGKSPVIEFNESDGSRNWKALNAVLQAPYLIYGNYTFSADIYATGTGTKIWFGFYYYNKSGVRNFHSGQTTVNITTINSWHRASGSIKLNNDIDLTKGVNFYIYAYGFATNSILYLTKPQLEEGTVPTPYGVSQSDIQADIDSKADQTLTLEQLNALNEKNQILEAELQAKASLDTFSEFEKSYQSFVSSNAENQAKSEADLVEAGRRIDMLVTQFGGLAELKTFIDTYMSSSNEGLIIGKNDASSTIKVSSDRISMFSAGKEVMYISQGVINIDNGIFTASVQIGKFRTEQYSLNADINVVRYVG